jgi:hypothetical protein
VNRNSVIELRVLTSIIILVYVQGQVVSSVDIKEKSVCSATFGIPLSIFNKTRVILFAITIFIAINVFFLLRLSLLEIPEKLNQWVCAILAKDQLHGDMNLDRRRGTEFN